ncbi:MAG TPA: ATP-binding cassette domain-containing protein [Myxococcaceae bacterium]|nr:ATP-binding cassette domain-containing protein [Myxococcaceae bacterium]
MSSVSDRKTSSQKEPKLEVSDLTMAYGESVVIRDLNFSVKEKEIFVIMGGSGSGKSTLLRHLVGLHEPARGTIRYQGTSSGLWEMPAPERERLLRRFGVLYQGGALWSSMTLGENVALPMQEYGTARPEEISALSSLKLALVGLAGFEDYYPAEISGGMTKRAGLARAMALDPDILFFDEPSAGLDPITSRRLDDLILDLRDSLGATIVVVTHELPSIFAIADNSVLLDGQTKTAIACGPPKQLLAESTDPRVLAFLTRGGGTRDA